MINLTKEQENILNNRLNNENEIYIKALMFYYFIMNKTMSYNQVAKILHIDYRKLLDIYDDLKVSTSEITLPEIETLLIDNELLDEKTINEFNEKEKVLC